MIDELCAFESSEQPTDGQIGELDIRELLESLPNIDSNMDAGESSISELISSIFDDSMTSENLLKLCHSSNENNAYVNGETCDKDTSNIGKDIVENSPNSINNNDEKDGQELNDSSQIIQNVSTDNSKINDSDTQSEIIMLDLTLDSPNSPFNFQTENTDTTADDMSNSIEPNETTELNRKRKLETISDLDSEIERMLSKQSRQDDEFDNVPMGRTLNFCLHYVINNFPLPNIVSNIEEILTSSLDDNDIEWLIEDELSDSVESIIYSQIDQIDENQNAEYLENGNVDNESENEGEAVWIANTNSEVHWKNSFYQEVCMLCDDSLMPNQNMSNHYMINHPDHEVINILPYKKLIELYF